MRMINITTIGAVALALSLTGCAQIKAIDDAAGRWAKEHKDKPVGIQVPGVGRAEIKSKDQGGGMSRDTKYVKYGTGSTPCGERFLDTVPVRVDPDTAYVRLKRHFAYRTLDERIQQSPYKARGWIDQGFKYEATPGARYWMKDEVVLRIGAGFESGTTGGISGGIDRIAYGGWLSTEIERDGPASSVVRINYCIGGREGFVTRPGLRDELIRQVKTVAEGGRRD